MKIFVCVLIALKNAYMHSRNLNSLSCKNTTLTNQNRLRSRLFVNHLAQVLRDIYINENNNYNILPDRNGKRNPKFGRKELLYDILVCDTESVPGVKHHKKDIRLIKKGLWAIESEFSSSTTEIIKDFNKLILSSCESKLFVGRSSQKYNNSFFDLFEKASLFGTGTFYVALIPHPNDWEQYAELLIDREVIEDPNLSEYGIETRVFHST